MFLHEHKEQLTPFPADPNKFEINKWMSVNGLPVPEIYPTAESVQEAIDRGEGVLARGYLIDHGVGKNGRRFCADELLIDVLPTEIVDPWISCQETFDRLSQEGNSLLQNPDFQTYCRECGIDPADLGVGYFFQKKIRDAFPVKILTADFIPPGISWELIDGITGEKHGSFFGLSGDYEAVIQDSILELHTRCREKLQPAACHDRWHLEMVGNLNEDKNGVLQPEEIQVVQARRIPLPVSSFKIVADLTDLAHLAGSEYKIVDMTDLSKEHSFDLSFYNLKVLILKTGINPERLNIGNCYGDLQAIVYCLQSWVSDRLLSHEQYRLIALLGAKNASLYLYPCPSEEVVENVAYEVTDYLRQN